MPEKLVVKGGALVPEKSVVKGGALAKVPDLPPSMVQTPPLACLLQLLDPVYVFSMG